VDFPVGDFMRRIGALDMIVEIGADGIRENQRVVNVLGDVFISHYSSIGAEPGFQRMRGLIINDGFDVHGLQIRHVQETTRSPFRSAIRREVGRMVRRNHFSGDRDSRRSCYEQPLVAPQVLHFMQVPLAHEGEIPARAAAVALEAFHPRFGDAPGMDLLEDSATPRLATWAPTGLVTS